MTDQNKLKNLKNDPKGSAFRIQLLSFLETDGMMSQKITVSSSQMGNGHYRYR